MNKLLASITTLLLAFVIGCGPDGGGGSQTLTGQLIDSPVGGVSYSTSPSNKQGVTNANGEYEYEPGDTVVFSIGAITFPPTTATGVVTPLAIAGTSDINDNTAVNIARLLQTLDYDGNPDNGLTITEATANAAASLSPGIAPADFGVTPAVFSTNEQVLEMVDTADLSNPNTELVSTEDAIAHLSEELALPPPAVACPPSVTDLMDLFETERSATNPAQTYLGCQVNYEIVLSTAPGLWTEDGINVTFYHANDDWLLNPGTGFAGLDFRYGCLACSAEPNANHIRISSQMGGSNLYEGFNSMSLEVALACVGHAIASLTNCNVQIIGSLTDADSDGYFLEVDDCNDTNPFINPGADEVNTVYEDYDCDGFPTAAPYSIGDYGPAGGKVFFVGPPFANGLEAALADQCYQCGTIWGVSIPSVIGVSGWNIGDGFTNTQMILDYMSGDIAAELAASYTQNGFNDYFLPSRDELNEMYLHRDMVGGFDLTWYWSSSESHWDPDISACARWFGNDAEGSAQYAWFCDSYPKDGDAGYVYDDVLGTRAIRQF